MQGGILCYSDPEGGRAEIAIVCGKPAPAHCTHTARTTLHAWATLAGHAATSALVFHIRAIAPRPLAALRSTCWAALYMFGCSTWRATEQAAMRSSSLTGCTKRTVGVEILRRDPAC